MRILIAIIVIVAAAWGGFWVYQSQVRDKALRTWMQERRDAGWVADASDITVRGFPNRLDATLSDINLVAADNSFAWSAPFLQTLQLVYEPKKLIIIWPNTQTFGTGDAAQTLQSRDMRASVVLAENGHGWDHATIDGRALALVDADGHITRADQIIAAMRTRDAANNVFDVAVTAHGYQPSSAALAFLDNNDLLPGKLETLEFDATVTLDAPIGSDTLTIGRPAIEKLELRNLRAQWGQLQLRAGGMLSVAPDGTPEGEITVKAKNWREMLDLAVQSGALSPDVAGPIVAGLELVAGSGGNTQTLDAPLTISNGVIYLGIIPIGSAPKIVLP